MLRVIWYRCGVHFLHLFSAFSRFEFYLLPFLWDRSWQAGKQRGKAEYNKSVFMTHLKTRWKRRIKLLLIRMIHILFILLLIRAGFSFNAQDYYSPFVLVHLIFICDFVKWEWIMLERRWLHYKRFNTLPCNEMFVELSKARLLPVHACLDVLIVGALKLYTQKKKIFSWGNK